VSTNRYVVGLALIIAGAMAAVYGYYTLGLILMLAAPAAWLYGNSLLTRARFSYGAMCIFLYVGAEVSIGSFIINYLLQGSVMANGGAVTTWINGTVTAILGLFGSTKTLEPNAVEWMIGLYWGGAMIGRFIGAAVLRYVSPGLVLAGVSFGAIMLILLSINSTGELAGYSLLCVGLMNSIMFPTIFSLACEKLGARAADGSGIINIAIFGGAVIPLITGMIADKTGSLAMSFILPAVCYAIIAGFGIFARRPA
jgi:MFS transporter, FHS family, L-fucose permease